MEILQRLRPFRNSLGEHLALLGQPLLLDDSEDRNNVREVFLFVPAGEDGHAEVAVGRQAASFELIVREVAGSRGAAGGQKGGDVD